MAAIVMRITVNGLGQVGLGWFAVQLSSCGTTNTLPAFCWYGILSGAAGLLMAIAYIPVYLFTVLLWAPWLGVILLHITPAPPRHYVGRRPRALPRRWCATGRRQLHGPPVPSCCQQWNALAVNISQQTRELSTAARDLLLHVLRAEGNSRLQLVAAASWQTRCHRSGSGIAGPASCCQVW
jgi:hypothetical protein